MLSTVCNKTKKGIKEMNRSKRQLHSRVIMYLTDLEYAYIDSATLFKTLRSRTDEAKSPFHSLMNSIQYSGEKGIGRLLDVAQVIELMQKQLNEVSPNTPSSKFPKVNGKIDRTLITDEITALTLYHHLRDTFGGNMDIDSPSFTARSYQPFFTSITGLSDLTNFTDWLSGSGLFAKVGQSWRYLHNVDLDTMIEKTDVHD